MQISSEMYRIPQYAGFCGLFANYELYDKIKPSRSVITNNEYANPPEDIILLTCKVK